MFSLHRSHLVTFLLLATFMTFPASLQGQDPPLTTDRWNRAALEWIRLLDEGFFREAGARVDPAVPEGAMGPEELETLWARISAQLGQLQSVTHGTVSQGGGYHLVDLPSTFENQSVVLRVVLTHSLLISGFFIRPAEPPPYESPGYVDPKEFQEVEVTVGSDSLPLPGILTIPVSEHDVPAVVLVHGSGPNDRDETIGPNRPFKDLAWGLGSRGIAVLRYDKRTRAHPTRVSSDIGLEEEVIQDALSALELARRHEEIDGSRVFLLGHSLGGILAPEIGLRDGGLAGIAILGGSARPFFQVLEGQLEYLAGLEEDSEGQNRRQLDSLISVVRGMEAGDVPDTQVVLGAPASYWRQVAGVDPVAMARRLSTPLFIAQGGRDYQATSEDLARWEAGLREKDRVQTRLYPELNHLFMAGAGMATPEEYVSGQGHVAEPLIQDLADWIHGAGGS